MTQKVTVGNRTGGAAVPCRVAILSARSMVRAGQDSTAYGLGGFGQTEYGTAPVSPNLSLVLHVIVQYRITVRTSVPYRTAGWVGVGSVRYWMSQHGTECVTSARSPVRVTIDVPYTGLNEPVS